MAGFQAQWAVNEFAGIDLNDKRLNTRVVTIATQFGTIGAVPKFAVPCQSSRCHAPGRNPSNSVEMPANPEPAPGAPTGVGTAAGETSATP